jgi:hypothetical protein
MTLAVGASLPRISFARTDSPGTVSWNQGTTAVAVFVPHQAPCPSCDRYLEELATAAEGLREWATRALVLVPAGRALDIGPGLVPLDDTSGAGRAHAGIDADQAAVIQADRWGAVYQIAVVGRESPHAELPTPHQLVDLAKYIDIQCPECGVPSREWLAASPFPLG